MLDFTKLTQAMQGMGRHLKEQSISSQRYLDAVVALLPETEDQRHDLVLRQQQWGDRLIFNAAEPVEPLTHTQAIATPPPQHTVCATDGSQLAPSHHEIAYCYLINIGRVAIPYGQFQPSPAASASSPPQDYPAVAPPRPLLDSQPEMVYRTDELYQSQQWGIPIDDWMGYRRTVAETTALTDLSLNYPHTLAPLENPPSNLENVPRVAMLDGSLIHWNLERLPHEARDRLLADIFKAWDTLQHNRIPLVGYISSSRSRAALNFLRLALCPYENPDCPRHCSGSSDRAPCEKFSALRDVTVWGTLLQSGQRGPLWKSHAKILDGYGDHHVYFCHLHVGSEVTRLEMPEWVAADAQLLDLALTTTLAQVQKGYGYPVALAEAHNQAVVRGSDRSRFYALLEQQLVRAGVANIRTSRKESRKRGSIA
ncbi:MAG: DNA double-strand break repair nuclease NurA [Leptolyngbyaceae bacterium]|nr:DNA double-strand break repair nuclease NurA [Leptolyngbyaceae bacterium]